MARRRVFVEEIRRGKAELTGSDAEHLVRVLRVEVGQIFEVSDNRRAYLATVGSARKSSVVFEVTDILPEEPSSIRVTLCPALFKFDRFEWMIEKATELGVTAIAPFEAARTDHGLLQASSKRIERWRRIVLEASQQSRRTVMPTINATARRLGDLGGDASLRLMLDEEPATPPLLTCLPSAFTTNGEVSLLVGPEGGWVTEEREAAMAAGWKRCSLGLSILRAETASIAALAVVRAAWDRQFTRGE